MSEEHNKVEIKAASLTPDTLIKAIESLRQHMDEAMGIPFDTFQRANRALKNGVCPQSSPPFGPHAYVAHYCVGEWVKVCDRCGHMVEPNKPQEDLASVNLPQVRPSLCPNCGGPLVQQPTFNALLCVVCQRLFTKEALYDYMRMHF